MEIFILIIFSASLLGCILSGISILYGLGFGLILFFLYGKKCGHSWKELLRMALSGIRTVKNILITFVLIGMLTALWRCSGTIAAIVVYTAPLIHPSVFLPAAFLLNCFLSYLTGTSFGTAATLGVICATIGSVLGVNPAWTGGAVLSGAFFGDRCSPVSTSALLVAQQTGTDIYHNLRRMFRTGLVPLFLSCLVYGLLGIILPSGGQIPDIRGVFTNEFSIHWTALIPAAVILLLSFLRVPVKLTMTASILSALLVCLFLQKTPPETLPQILLSGFRASREDVAVMMNGGGILSMVNVAAIVCLSSTYAGIFQGTGMIRRFQKGILRLSEKTSPYVATVCTAIPASLVSCNQTLAILLTHQLAGGIARTPSDAAVYLENSAVIIAPLVPWSIAGAVPLATIGAPHTSIFFACYLYLIIIWCIFRERMKNGRDIKKRL